MTTLAKKTTFSAAATAFASLGRFIAGATIARLLGAEDTGEAVYWIWLSEIGCLLASLGLANALTRFGAEVSGEEQKFALARWILRRYLVAIVVSAAVVIVLLMRSSDVLDFRIVIFAVLYFTQGLANFSCSLISGLQDFPRLAKLNLVSSAILIVAAALGSSLFGIAGAIAAYAISFAVFLTAIRIPKVDATIESGLAARVWRYSISYWLTIMTSSFVWTRTEVFFLERYRSVTEVALFNVGLSLAALAGQLAPVLTSAFVPHVAALAGRRETARIGSIYQSSLRYLALLLFPLSLNLAVYCPLLIRGIYGPDFVGALPAAYVLVASSVCGLFYVVNAVVFGLERSIRNLQANAIGAFLSIVCGFLIIPAFGLMGASVSRLLVQILVLALGVTFLKRDFGFSFPGWILLKNLLAAALSACGAYFSQAFSPGLIGAIAGLFISIAIYSLSLWLLRLLRKEDIKELLKLL